MPGPGAAGTIGSGQGNNMGAQLSTGTVGGSSGPQPNPSPRPSISQNQQRQASDCSSSQHTVSNLVTMLNKVTRISLGTTLPCAFFMITQG